MKYQCLVCGQIIDQNDVCPICGSDSSKIVELGDNIETTTYRCLSCGRIFENKDVCPFCGGEELFDLTHDKMFNRNDKKEEAPKVKIEEEPMNLFSDFDHKEEFEDKPVSIDNQAFYHEEEETEVKEEPKEEVDPTLITDDEFENSDIIVSDDYNVETNDSENVEEIKEDFHAEEKPADDTHVSEENIDVDLYNDENHEDASSLEESLYFNDEKKVNQEETKEQSDEEIVEIKPVETPKVAHYEEFAEFSDSTEEEVEHVEEPKVETSEKKEVKVETFLDSREDLINSISLKVLNLLKSEKDDQTKLFLFSLLGDLNDGNETDISLDDVFDGINHLLTLDSLEFSKNPIPENGYLLIKHKKILDNLLKKLNKGK